MYRVDCGLAEDEVDGAVKRISALKEVGKSFRKTFVSSRWCGGGCELLCLPLLLSCGDERTMDQASPLRNNVFVADMADELDKESAELDVVSRLRELLICWLDCRSSCCLLSSHCVLHRPAKKSV